MYGAELDREAKERLIEAARLAAVGRLLRPVAHELSTPLAAIALRAESLDHAAEKAEAGSAPAADKQRRYLKAMIEESQRCRDLLATVREFAAGADSGTTSVDLASLCRGAARLVAHEAMRRQIQVAVDGQATTFVRGRSHSLAQAVLALVMNGVDASPQGGKVGVEARSDAGEALVAVEDEGEGIPEAIRERLFQPFASTREPARGLGLGLMACRLIAEMHGGSIEWQPRPTRGTRFVLRLPSGRPTSAEGEPRADA